MTPANEPVHMTEMTGANRRAFLLMQGQKALRSLPRAIYELGSIFADAGHELALVGGPVRDAFLGLPIHDFDFTTSARPGETQELLDSWGSTTWDVGREFGTIGSVRRDLTVEVTTYRTDSYDVGSRKPSVDYGDTLEGDLARRDFTVNAMAVRLPSIELVDPCGGLDQLVDGVLSTPVTAVQSFDDDPLRIMRAARFAAQLGFDVAQDVMAAMGEMAGRLSIVSAERIRAEIERLLVSDAPRRGVELLVYTGVADVVLPELALLRDTVDEHGRHKDVYEHTLTVLDQAMALEGECDYEPDLLGGPLPRPDLVLRLAALLHDIGKPATRRYERDGSVTFRGHDVVGGRMAAKRLRALRFDKQTERDVARLVELHLRAFGFSEQGWTDSAVRRRGRHLSEPAESRPPPGRQRRTRAADRRTGRARGPRRDPPGHRRVEDHGDPRARTGAPGRPGQGLPARTASGGGAPRPGRGRAPPAGVVGRTGRRRRSRLAVPFGWAQTRPGCS